MEEETKKEIPLSEREQDRVDSLLSSARTLNYLSFIIAGISLSLSSLDDSAGIKLPVGDLTLPSTQAAVGAYIVSIILAVVSEQLFRMAYIWLPLDPRRPPFAWFPLGAGKTNQTLVTLLLFTPVIGTAIAAAMTLGNDPLGITLLISGFFLSRIPDVVGRYVKLLRNRTDLRGGKATLSIWLLYWLRIVRMLVFTAMLLFPVLAVIPKWRAQMLRAAVVATVIAGVIEAIRALGGLIHKQIDQVGLRYGFSDRYKSETKHSPHQSA